MIYIRFPAKLNVKKSSEKLAFKYLFSEISMHIQMYGMFFEILLSFYIVNIDR